MSLRIRKLVVTLLFLPIWLLSAAMFVRDAARDTPYPRVGVEFSANHRAPVVVRAYRELEPQRGLEAGDQLIRWEGEPLTGLDPHGYAHVVATKTPRSHIATVTAKRGEDVFRTQVRAISFRDFAPRLIAGVVFMTVALILCFRLPLTDTANSFILMMLGGALMFVCTFGGSRWMLLTAESIQLTGVTLLSAFSFRAFALFARDEHVPVRWVSWLPWLLALTGPLDLERSAGYHMSPRLADSLVFILSLVGYVSTALLLAYVYRRAALVARRRIKWIAWGVYIAIAAPMTLAITSFLGLSRTMNSYIANISLAIIPLTILIAITRFNLFDVNRVISLTIVYSIAVGIVFIGILTTSISAIGSAAMAVDLPASLLQALMLSVLLAAAAIFHRSLLSRVERFLLPERAHLIARATNAMRTLRSAGSPMETITGFVDALRVGLEPITLAVYSRSGSAWVNIYAFGPAITPILPANSQLVEHMERTAAILNLERGAPRVLTRGPSDPFVTGAGLSLVLPIFVCDALSSLVFMGTKRSDDVYVSSELSLITAMLSVVSERLSRFEHGSLLQDTLRAAECLRRYVPAAVAQEILAGRSLESGECPVTLMFVDMRGYSAFAETRSVTQVFSLLDAHTQRVSAIVSRHGGHVVEFNGDGMMAVFGAPDALANKEERAAAAAREIHRELAGLSTDEPARVGVGIATGNAYVGSLRAVDRWIWTAVGDATNRAARLQALTRELEAETVIDESTWRGLDRERSGFYPLHRHKLRGLAQKQNLFLKPLYIPIPASAAASALSASAAPPAG